MAQVTCPRCQTRQPLGDAAPGYTCSSCAAAWAFTVCEDCGVRFHMRPGTTDWICPECGHENGSATMREFEPEPDAKPEVEPAGLVTGQGEAMPPRAATASSRSRRRPTRVRLATIAIVGVSAVLVIAFGLSASGAGSAPANSPHPSASLTTTQTLCLHLRDLQTLREDALTRLAHTLGTHAATVAVEGDYGLSADVMAMRSAVLAYRDALAAHGDTSAASAQLASAYSTMPC